MKCGTDADCRLQSPQGSCIPETRIFVQLDRADAIPMEFSDDNNMGWHDLAGEECIPFAVPEPDALLSMLAVLRTMLVLQRPRAGQVS